MHIYTIWTIEGKIKAHNKEAYITLLDEFVEKINNESATLSYEWTIAQDKETIYVYEQFQNESQNYINIIDLSQFAQRYLDIVEIDRFHIFSDLPPEQKNALSALNPSYINTQKRIFFFFST